MRISYGGFFMTENKKKDVVVCRCPYDDCGEKFELSRSFFIREPFMLIRCEHCDRFMSKIKNKLFELPMYDED